MGPFTQKIGALMGAFWLLSACQGIADPAAPAAPSVGDSGGYGFSDELFGDVQEMMENAIEDGRIPSAIAMVARGDEILWLGTAGEMGPGVAMRADAIMPLASVGKIYTGVAAMILYERGVIFLDDPVSLYIPEFADVMVEVEDEAGETRLETPERAVTIRHLLTHTGGLTVRGDEFWAAWNAHVGRTTTTQFARALAQMPLRSQPGARFDYGPTGASYEVLGAVIEIASGQTLEAFMTENIFEPLGLHDTYFYLPDEASDRLPAFYRQEEGALVLDRPYGEDFPRSTFFHGGGGVSSAPDDILRFARLFLNGGEVDGVRILRPETIALMMTDHLGALSTLDDGRSWGFGGAVRYFETGADAGALDWYGWNGGGYATLWVEPREQLVAYFAFPLAPPGDNGLLHQFRRLVSPSLRRALDRPWPTKE